MNGLVVLQVGGHIRLRVIGEVMGVTGVETVPSDRSGDKDAG